MLDYFLDKYKDKPDADLVAIFNNKVDYRLEAVDAAIKIYNERNNTEIPCEGSYQSEPKTKSKNIKNPVLNFLMLLRLGDLYTLIVVSFALLAMFQLINLYQGEEWLEDKSTLLRLGLFFASILCIHIFYKNDNNISSNYFNRVQFDFLYFIFLVFSKYVIDFLFLGYSPSYDAVGNVVLILFILLVLILLIELIVELIKIVLNLLKIDII